MNDFVEDAVKGLIKAVWKRALTLPDPKKDPDLAYFRHYLLIEQGIEPEDLPLEVWETAVAEIIAEAIVDEWERHGAPSVAHGETKEKAEREARKAWIMRILEVRLGLGRAKQPTPPLFLENYRH